MTKDTEYEKVIIIGAARSGTNILRDVITRLPDTGTWPCDEINYIWRHGNSHQANDEFDPDLAREDVRAFVTRAFDMLADKYKYSRIIEKTCANSLRVAFVDRIFPDTKYIFIVRDGQDVVSSAIKRWQAPLDLPYIIRKAKYVPFSDVPHYAIRYIWNRIHQVTKGRGDLAYWGPRFVGMEEVQANYPLAGVCALQWSRSVEKADSALANIDSSRVISLKYEQFVQQPAIELHRIAAFLGIELKAQQAKDMVVDVSAAKVGNWRFHLEELDLELVHILAGNTLIKHGYR